MKVLLWSLVSTIVFLPVMGRLVRVLDLKRTNFKGRVIPAGFGFLIVMAAVPVMGAVMFGSDARAAVYLAGLAGFGLVGLLDDVYGARDAGGFRGHLGLLRRGRVSTGLVKAGVGGALGLLLGFLVSGFLPAAGLVNGLLIGLSANFVNLLDLRPGRAVSCFWLGMAALLLARGDMPAEFSPLILPVVVPAAVVGILDRSARVMLGDSGSNALGAVLGISAAYFFALPVKLALVGLLAAVHLYAERYSISGLIEGNRVLRRLDGLLGER